MKAITLAELANKTNFELSALYAQIKEEMEGTDPNSYEYGILATSLDNILRAYKVPRIKPPGM
jgi:hypothetical protein